MNLSTTTESTAHSHRQSKHLPTIAAPPRPPGSSHTATALRHAGDRWSATVTHTLTDLSNGWAALANFHSAVEAHDAATSATLKGGEQ